MEINRNTLVSDIVSENYHTVSLFNKYSIDFCCNGNRTLEVVCEEKDIDCSALIKALKEPNTTEKNTINHQYWDLDFLSDYIYQKHHLYVEEKIPQIKKKLTKICEEYGERHPSLFEVKDLFIASAGELTMHMKKEELMLFPYIRKIAKAFKNGSRLTLPVYGSVSNPISKMHIDHEEEGDRFRKIATLTNNYRPPKDTCSSYAVTFSQLKEFEEDLHKHIHLENNILFKRAIELEKIINK